MYVCMYVCMYVNMLLSIYVPGEVAKANKSPKIRMNWPKTNQPNPKRLKKTKN